MREADHCPIPGPCAECASPDPHYCELGEREKSGSTLRAALRDTLVALEFAKPGKAADRARIFRRLLDRLCRFHRLEAQALHGLPDWDADESAEDHHSAT